MNIRYLDTYCRLARNRRFNSYSVCGKIKRYIVGKIGYLLYLYSRRRLKLVSRYGRSSVNPDNSRLNAKGFKSFNKLLRLFFYFSLCKLRRSGINGIFKNIDWRINIGRNGFLLLQYRSLPFLVNKNLLGLRMVFLF